MDREFKEQIKKILEEYFRTNSFRDSEKVRASLETFLDAHFAAIGGEVRVHLKEENTFECIFHLDDEFWALEAKVTPSLVEFEQ